MMKVTWWQWCNGGIADCDSAGMGSIPICHPMDKEEYYEIVCNYTRDPIKNCEISWTMLPTHRERAMGHAYGMLKYYQERNDVQGIFDLEWIISKIWGWR